MATRRNKSAKIRLALAAHPKATAKEIVAALKAQHVHVSAAHVYNVKSTMGKSSNGRHSNGTTSAYDSLIQAKKLADAMGGIDKAREALAVACPVVYAAGLFVGRVELARSVLGIKACRASELRRGTWKCSFSRPFLQPLVTL
jgi:hypothetical protein